MKTALLYAILTACFLFSRVPCVIGAEVQKARVAAMPTQEEAIKAIASLADPVKLATLGVRGANTRVQKITYWLFIVRQNGGSPEAAIDTAFARFGWKGTPQGEETKLTMMRNFRRALDHGCFNAEGLAEMRRGNAPRIPVGRYIGDEMGIDHVLPRSKVPELDNVLANLELMPTQMNRDKSAKLEDRQREFARRFVAAGLISAEAVEWAGPFEVKPQAKTPVKVLQNVEPAAVPAISGSYFASKSGKVFHKAGCSFGAKIYTENKVEFSSREEAIQDGKRPCASCKP